MVLGAARGGDIGRARAAAGTAMRAAGIDVRPAESPADIQQVRAVLDEVFRPEPGESEASLSLLVALAHTGQYVVLARDLRADGHPVLATSVGFFCAPDRSTLHSHVTAVREAGRGRRAGWAVKLHQRCWAMTGGLDTITWTFDPLVRRNAWFNITKLGALPTAFEVDLYGAIADAVNTGDESDRLVLAWRLWSERVVAACGGAPSVPAVAGMLQSGVPQLLTMGAGEVPLRASLPPGARSGLVQVPPDIEAMREGDPALALRWRQELRAAFTGAGERGLEVTGMGRDGWYVLGPGSAEGDPA
jgi:predicted GNAT superfamily acetyltransferase